MSDQIIRATGETAELRIVLVDATEAANTIGDYHGASSFARILLGEAIASALLLASGLKANGTAQVQFQFSGDVSRVSADATPMGLVRGTIPKEDVRDLGAFEPLLSPQLLKVRKLNEEGTLLSEGLVEMVSENIGLSTAFYLLQSEQTKSAVGIKAMCDKTGSRLEFCGGFLVEAFPKADEKTISIMEQVVRNLPNLSTYAHYATSTTSTTHNESAQGLNLPRLLDNLAGPFKYKIHREIDVKAFCPCSEAGVLKALSGLPKIDLEEIILSQQTTELHCEYCRKRYFATPEQIASILKNLDSRE